MQNIQFSAVSHFPLYSHRNFTANCCFKCIEQLAVVKLEYWGLLYHLHIYIVLCMANTCTVYSLHVSKSYFQCTAGMCLVCLKPLNTYCLCQVLHHINDKRPTGDPILHPAQPTIVSLQL